MENFIVHDVALYPETLDYVKYIKVLDTYKNLDWLLKSLNAEVKYNLMNKDREITIPGVKISVIDSENDALARIDRIATINKMPTRKLDSHLDVIAKENSYHPIVNCIMNKPWDGIKRLDQFINTVKTTNQNFSNKIIKTWMCTAIAAAFTKDGFVNQGVLVLEGEQGIGKTSWVKSLEPIPCGSVREGFFLDPTNKDSVSLCARYWIVELGELDATFRKSDIARLKSFITNQDDILRYAYARKMTQLIRRTVFVATVNESNYLIDDTGNRRWWTISVQSVDLNHGLDMQQIWAEVYDLYKNGMSPYLSRELQIDVNYYNQDHEKLDPFKELLITHYDWDSHHRRSLTATAILNELGYSKPTRSEVTRMASLLKMFNNKPARKSHGVMLHDIPFLIKSINF